MLLDAEVQKPATAGLDIRALLREHEGRNYLIVQVKYVKTGEPVIHGLKRVSSPGLRVYASVKDIPEDHGGLGIAILTTPKGLLTGKDARKQNLGGEVLAHVW